jgi:hypothetical protein
VGVTMPGFDLTSWNGIFGPAGMPKPIVDKLSPKSTPSLGEGDSGEAGGDRFGVAPKTPEEFGNM